MSSELVRDRLVLGLLFVVGGSSLLWGLYLIFYVAQTSPSGIFNTILGLLVLLVTWGFLLPYALPAERAGRADDTPPRPSAGARGAPAAAAAPVPARPTLRPVAPARPPTTPAARPSPIPAPTGVRRPAASAAAGGTTTVSGTVPPPSTPSGRAPPTPATSPAEPSLEERRSRKEDEEIESILADLPGPVDPTLASASPDEMIRRLDALLDDLSSGSG